MTPDVSLVVLAVKNLIWSFGGPAPVPLHGCSVIETMAVHVPEPFLAGGGPPIPKSPFPLDWLNGRWFGGKQ